MVGSLLGSPLAHSQPRLHSKSEGADASPPLRTSEPASPQQRSTADLLKAVSDKLGRLARVHEDSNGAQLGTMPESAALPQLLSMAAGPTQGQAAASLDAELQRAAVSISPRGPTVQAIWEQARAAEQVVQAQVLPTAENGSVDALPLAAGAALAVQAQGAAPAASAAAGKPRHSYFARVVSRLTCMPGAKPPAGCLGRCPAWLSTRVCAGACHLQGADADYDEVRTSVA